MKLKEKVCLITGATSGMGKAIANLFSEEGANLILSGRNEDSGNQLAAEIIKKGSKAFFHPGDISRPEVNKQLVDLAMDQFGQLDTLVVNAGTLGLGSITEVSIEDWHHTLDTNFNSLFYLAKYSIPHLIKQKGTIVANASIAAFKNFPNHGAYCASKAAMVALTKQLAFDYGPHIRANAMCPGPVDTPLIWDSAQAFEKSKKAVSEARNSTLLKRLGSPEDVAKLALFLASDESSWITGATINIDGGIMTAS